MYRFLKSSTFLLLAVAFTLSLSACDSGGSNEEDDVPEVEEGRVAVSIDGDASGSFDGYAFFVEETDSTTGTTQFGIMLSETNMVSEENGEATNNNEFIVILRESGRPSVGQYSFAEYNGQNDNELSSENFAAVALSFVGSENSYSSSLYWSNGGTLTITNSSEDRVAGSFEINAVGQSLIVDSQESTQEEVNITIEGAFDAESASTLYDFWND